MINKILVMLLIVLFIFISFCKITKYSAEETIVLTSSKPMIGDNKRNSNYANFNMFLKTIAYVMPLFT